MAGKTAGDGSKPYSNGSGKRPWQGNQTVEPNAVKAPEPTPSWERDIHKMPVPVTDNASE